LKTRRIFVGVEHDGLAGNAGTDTDLLRWCVHGRNGAGVPCAPQLGRWCGQHPHSREGAPGLRGVVVIVRDNLTTEPPAHCRLVSDHDLFEIVACVDCTASGPRTGPATNGRMIYRHAVSADVRWERPLRTATAPRERARLPRSSVTSRRRASSVARTLNGPHNGEAQVLGKMRRWKAITACRAC
jgi:hypothetical protein